MLVKPLPTLRDVRKPLERTRRSLTIIYLAPTFYNLFLRRIRKSLPPTASMTRIHYKTYGNKRSKKIGALHAAVSEKARRFPPHTGVKVSISECSLNAKGALLFRGRKWVPEYEPLRTKLMQHVHDSILTGHPGREATLAILSRMFFWPGMSSDVRRFTRNCHQCRGNHVWRERRHGLLRPLPIPNRIW